MPAAADALPCLSDFLTLRDGGGGPLRGHSIACEEAPIFPRHLRKRNAIKESPVPSLESDFGTLVSSSPSRSLSVFLEVEGALALLIPILLDTMEL